MDQSIVHDVTQMILRHLLEVRSATGTLKIRDVAEVVKAGIEAALVYQRNEITIPSPSNN